MFADGLPLIDAFALVEKHTLLHDPQVLPHIANMLAFTKKTKSPEDLIHLSNLVKQTKPSVAQSKRPRQ